MSRVSLARAPAEEAAVAVLDYESLVAELYRGTLDREPDPEGLRHHCRELESGKTVSEVLRAFVGSSEFRDRHGTASTPDPFIHVDFQPPMRIDLEPGPQQMARLWAHVGTTWASLGQEDPYWSVLTDPRFRMEHMSDAALLELFYASGQGDLRRLDAWLRRNGLALRSDMVVAEYGCGVGRLTGWLARRCKRVRAFDISPTHLARAETWLRGQQLRNVDFLLVRSPSDLNKLAGIDLFFSAIVLQHNPPPIMALVLDHAFRHLNPGGIAFFQIPTHTEGYNFDLEHYLSHLGGHDGMEMHCLSQQDVFRLANRHGLIAQEIEQDSLIGTWGTSHTFLFRK